MKFKGIIFDMDGTITVPVISFAKIREELGVEDGLDLLEAAEQLPVEKRKAFLDTIEKYELKALNEIKFQENVEEVLSSFIQSNIKLAVVTRNSTNSANRVLEKLKIKFDPVLTRDYEFVKPSPEPVKFILKKWNLSYEDVLMVGDFLDDITCGRSAGVKTCFYKNKDKLSYSEYADFSVSSFKELSKYVFNY